MFVKDRGWTSLLLVVVHKAAWHLVIQTVTVGNVSVTVVEYKRIMHHMKYLLLST